MDVSRESGCERRPIDVASLRAISADSLRGCERAPDEHVRAESKRSRRISNARVQRACDRPRSERCQRALRKRASSNSGDLGRDRFRGVDRARREFELSASRGRGNAAISKCARLARLEADGRLALAHLAIWNRSLLQRRGPDDDDGGLLAYIEPRTSDEPPTKRARQIGLAQGLVDFVRMLDREGTGAQLRVVHSAKRRIVFVEVEEGFWAHAVRRGDLRSR